MKKHKPRRSLLYMPGANERAMQKVKSIDTDVVIFDLEDAVSPESKALARQQVFDAIGSGGYGHRELVVRVNSLSTEWGRADVERFSEAALGPRGLPPRGWGAAPLPKILRPIHEFANQTMNSTASWPWEKNPSNNQLHLAKQ